VAVAAQTSPRYPLRLSHACAVRRAGGSDADGGGDGDARRDAVAHRIAHRRWLRQSARPQLALIVGRLRPMDCNRAWIRRLRNTVDTLGPTRRPLHEYHRHGGVGCGKGVMLHLPMETLSGLNPGPEKVTPNERCADRRASSKRPRGSSLARGVNNHEGSKASADPRVMRAVIRRARRAQPLLHRFEDQRSVGRRGHRAPNGVQPPRATSFWIIGPTWHTVKRSSLRRPRSRSAPASAIAIGHPRPTTLAAVRAMIPRLQALGVQFVLVQDLVGKNGP